MNKKEADQQWCLHEEKRCLCEPHIPSTYCYKACGFIEGYAEGKKESQILVEALDQIRKKCDKSWCSCMCEIAGEALNKWGEGK